MKNKDANVGSSIPFVNFLPGSIANPEIETEFIRLYNKFVDVKMYVKLVVSPEYQLTEKGLEKAILIFVTPIGETNDKNLKFLFREVYLKDFVSKIYGKFRNKYRGKLKDITDEERFKILEEYSIEEIKSNDDLFSSIIRQHSNILPSGIESSTWDEYVSEFVKKYDYEIEKFDFDSWSEFQTFRIDVSKLNIFSHQTIEEVELQRGARTVQGLSMEQLQEPVAQNVSVEVIPQSQIDKLEDTSLGLDDENITTEDLTGDLDESLISNIKPKVFEKEVIDEQIVSTYDINNYMGTGNTVSHYMYGDIDKKYEVYDYDEGGFKMSIEPNDEAVRRYFTSFNGQEATPDLFNNVVTLESLDKQGEINQPNVFVSTPIPEDETIESIEKIEEIEEQPIDKLDVNIQMKKLNELFDIELAKIKSHVSTTNSEEPKKDDEVLSEPFGGAPIDVEITTASSTQKIDEAADQIRSLVAGIEPINIEEPVVKKQDPNEYDESIIKIINDTTSGENTKKVKPVEKKVEMPTISIPVQKIFSPETGNLESPSDVLSNGEESTDKEEIRLKKSNLEALREKIVSGECTKEELIGLLDEISKEKKQTPRKVKVVRATVKHKKM